MPVCHKVSCRPYRSDYYITTFIRTSGCLASPTEPFSFIYLLNTHSPVQKSSSSVSRFSIHTYRAALLYPFSGSVDTPSGLYLYAPFSTLVLNTYSITYHLYHFVIALFKGTNNSSREKSIDIDCNKHGDIPWTRPDTSGRHHTL